MAYAFTNANSRYLTATAPVTTTPMTTFARFNQPSAASRCVMCLSIATANGVSIRSYTSATSNQWYTYSFNVGATRFEQATLGLAVPLNTWNTIVSTLASATSRTVWANGSANTATNSNNLDSGTPTQLTIGAEVSNSSPNIMFDGSIADAAVWSVSLSNAEIDALHKGFKPTRIRPQELKFYSPLIRTLQDVRGGLAITNVNGATVSVHPRVY